MKEKETKGEEKKKKKGEDKEEGEEESKLQEEMTISTGSSKNSPKTPMTCSLHRRHHRR
ncbi:hypothetical protein AGMMS49531_01090 [Endomicrobiia bacterium]|nr:hypothetical protein AGMMS49531_01090 [Endomicrobiia bacterium]